MYRYRLKTQIHNRYRVRTFDPKRFAPLALTMCVGAMVACGFVYVSWQHVEAVRIRQESESLKRQKVSLDQSERRLELEKQRKLSPETVELVARPFGYIMPRPHQTVAVQAPNGSRR